MRTLTELYKVVSNDMQEDETRFLNDIVTTMNKDGGELKLKNLVAVINCRTVIINDELKSIIKKTAYVKKYGLEKALDFFRKKMELHIKQVVDNNITDIDDSLVMLTCISSIPITAKSPVTAIPGSSYHRDGGGRPITTKITQTENKKWKGGELHMVEYVGHSDYIAKGTDVHPGKAIECLGKGQSIVFNNQDILHAVNPSLVTQEESARRTIFQERLNRLGAFNMELLLQFGPIPIPLPLVSMLQVYLSETNPVILPRRMRQLEDMTRKEQEYVNTNETPNRVVQEKLEQKHGDDFASLVQQLDKNGVLILPKLLDKDFLQALQAHFEKEISKKAMDPFLKQASFNAAVDNVDEKTKSTVEKLAEHAPLQALIQHYLGQNEIALASWRGYRQDPRESLEYRAWGFHNDQKALGAHGEIKAMILINDLPEDGQAMRVIPGSHKNHWAMPSQKFSKYTAKEALSFAAGEETATICYGKAGTVILFDTNVVHSGFRNLSERRDVITINFVPALENSPIMFADKVVLINSMTQEKVPDKVWANLRHAAVNDEQNLSAEKVLDMVNDPVPLFEHVKSRFKFEKDSMDFFQFLEGAVQGDLSADLDLPIRFGTQDVERDKQFVAFRDAGSQHVQYKRLHDKLSKKDIEIGFVININQAKNCINDVVNNDHVNKAAEQNIFAQRTLSLLNDLLVSINHNDGIQRLRTNLIYTYFSIELILNNLSDSSSPGFFPKEKNNETHNLLTNSVNSILSMYVSAVYLDDLNENLRNGVRDTLSLS